MSIGHVGGQTDFNVVSAFGQIERKLHPIIGTHKVSLSIILPSIPTAAMLFTRFSISPGLRGEPGVIHKIIGAELKHRLTALGNLDPLQSHVGAPPLPTIFCTILNILHTRSLRHIVKRKNATIVGSELCGALVKLERLLVERRIALELVHIARGSRWVFIGVWQRIHGTPLIQIVPLITKTLVSPRYGIHALMTNCAGWVVHGGVVGVRQGCRVGCSWGRFFNVYTQEMEIRPAGTGSIAVGIGGGVTAQPRGRTQDTGVGPILVVAKRCYGVGLVILPIIFIKRHVARIFSALEDV